MAGLDVGPNEGYNNQRKEFLYREIVRHQPQLADTSELLYGDLELIHIRLINEGIIPKISDFEERVIALEESITVKNFQAKGDGVTNDTAAFQNALNAIRNAGGGELVVPAGVYKCGKLTIFRNTTLKLLPGAVIKRKGLSFGLVNYEAGVNPLLSNSDPYSGHGNIKVIGGTWDSDFLNEPYVPAGFDLFYFTAARDLTFEGITVKDVLVNHALDLNGVANVVVRDSNFLGFKDTSTEQDKNYVEAIQYSQNTDESMVGATYVLGTPSTNITLENNTFGPSGTAGTASWPSAFGNHSMTNDPLCNDITIRNNTFNGQTFAGVVPYTYNDVKITGNTFNACAFGIKGNNFTNGTSWNKVSGTRTTGLATRAETSGMYIAHNRFNDTINTDISILGTNADGGGFWAVCSDIVISDNIMKATTATKRTGENIRLLLCRDAVIHDNKCENGQINIVTDSCVRSNIHDNSVSGSVTYGIRTQKSSTPPGTDSKYAVGNRICNNRVLNAGSHGIGNNENFDSIVQGNIVTDWGRVSSTANGILTSVTDTSLISGNTIRTTFTGLGPAMAVSTGGTTNIKTTYDNMIVKPDGSIIAMGTGVNNTYGNLTYV